ncbi:MAG TPA: hypothetical protein VHE80_06225 [Acidimicrobiales bacterium]|nr:hypothetical protein [Acidimicrobiales bacterium]
MARLSPLGLQRAPATEPGRNVHWLLVVAAGALAVRVAYVLLVLPDYSPVRDAHHYHSIAEAVGDGRGLVHPFPFGTPHATAWRPPLYPVLLGGLYAVAGPKLGAAQALNVGLGVGVVVLAALVARRLAGWRAGVVAGALTAVFPPLVFNDGVPLSEPLGLLLLLGTVLLLSDGRTALAGLSSGLLMLTRPSAQFFTAAVAAWVLWRFGWRKALVYGALATVVVAPWLVRNWVRMDSPVLVTSNGFNLNAAYSPEARATQDFVDAVLDPRLAGVRAGITNAAELDSVLRRRALRSVREDPAQVAKVAVRNVRNLLELRPSRNENAEKKDGRNLQLRRLSLPLVWVVLAAGLAGLWSLRRQPGVGPLAVAALVFTGTSALSVFAPRLRAPLELVCCITASALVARWWQLRAVARETVPAAA